MTGSVGHDRSEQLGAMDIRRRAGEWLVARNTADLWSEDDQKALDQWLAESPENLLAYWRLEASWDRARRLSVMRGPMRPLSDQERKRGPFDFLRLPVAATLLILVGLGAIALLRTASHAPTMQSYATAVGGHKILKLADGSTIELTTSTAIRLAIGTDRRVWLDRGEAYFQVVHDAAHPFVLEVRGQRITDLGTKFLVQSKDDRVDVMVADGKVRIESSAAQPRHEAVSVGADELATASVDSVAVVKKSAGEIEAELSWRRGVLVFDETPLREVANEFNRYNTTKLVLADEKTANLSVGGTFPTSGVESFVRVAQHILKLRAEKRGDLVFLSR
jgi:transmembrane sensor